MLNLNTERPYAKGAPIMAKRKKQDEEVDRRNKRRFNIEQGLRYKLLYGSRVAETGSGRTVNISSSGVWFTTKAF